MSVETSDWSRMIVDHIDVHASDYAASTRFYETVLGLLAVRAS